MDTQVEGGEMITKRLKEVEFQYNPNIKYPLNLKTTLVKDTILKGIIDLTKREALAFIMWALKNMELTKKQRNKIDFLIKRNRVL